MKLEIERQDFLKAWQNAEKLTASKTSNESAKGVLITASEDNTVILEATDLSTSIRCRAKGANVTEPGKAVIPAAIFGGILRKLDTEDFVLEVNSERGFLNAGRNKMRFAVISAETFPNIPESSSAEVICEIPAPVLARIIAEGSSAASQPQDFPKYLGTCLMRCSGGQLTAVSTDGKRLSLSKAPCMASKDEDLLLPANSLKELGKNLGSLGEEKTVRILSGDSVVWFGLEEAEYSIRSVEASFPKYERILNEDKHTILKTNAAELLKVLERIDIIAKTTTAHIMSVSMNPGGDMRITARAPELGTASETLQPEITGEYLQLGFNVGYFMDGLKALGNEQAVIEFSGEEGQTRMKRDGTEDFLYMLMPARLSTQDAMTEEESADFTSAPYEPMPEPENQQEQPQESQESESQQNNESDTPF
ncbi:MAG: DNA polymerase III subunit beta [Synergistaceae bacterium]|nr:DNA polymerase III subunit beta [Synergistaceae bacterium]